MSTEYIKTYKPLAIWLGAYVAVLAALPATLFSALPGGMLTSAMLACVYLGLLALFILIHQGGYVYWINGGPSFEEARDAGEENRRAYAWEHLKRFMLAGAALIPYLVLASILRWPAWLNIVVFGAVVISAALSTVNIRCESAEEERE